MLSAFSEDYVRGYHEGLDVGYRKGYHEGVTAEAMRWREMLPRLGISPSGESTS